MIAALLVLLLQSPARPPVPELAQNSVEGERCVQIGESTDQRSQPPPKIAPGQPPILSFRYYEGKLHHKFGNSDLMLDDAGH